MQGLIFSAAAILALAMPADLDAAKKNNSKRAMRGGRGSGSKKNRGGKSNGKGGGSKKASACPVGVVLIDYKKSAHYKMEDGSVCVDVEDLKPPTCPKMTIVELDSVGIAYPGWVDINEQAAYVAAYTGNVETETNDSYSCSPPVSPSIPKCPLEQVVAYLESVENNTYYMRYYSSPGQECRIPEGMQGFPLRESNGRYYISYGICTRDVSDDLHQKWSEHVYKNEKEAHVPEWMTKDRFVPIFVGNNFIPCADKAEIIKTLGL